MNETSGFRSEFVGGARANDHADHTPFDEFECPGDDAPRRPRRINAILDEALNELHKNARKPALQLAAIQLAAQRLHPFGDAGIEPRDFISDAAQGRGLDPDEVQRRLNKGIEQAIANPSQGDPADDLTPFAAFDAGNWEGVPIEPRRWIVHHRIPVGEPGIMSGDGGTGKTKLLLQLAIALGAELPDWVGGVVETHGPVVVYSAEEKLKEMHRRCEDVLVHRGLTFANVKGRLHFICDEDDPVLATADENKSTVTPTKSLLRLEKTLNLIRPVLIIVENAADVYAGNESNRALVTRFVRKHLGGLGKSNEATPVLIQHPSVSGLQDGTGRSGTTGWNNAGRWRMNFTKIKPTEEQDSGLRQLEVVKSNYGPDGEKVRVRWERGVFVPEGITATPERAAAEAVVDEAFMRCLEVRTAQGLNVVAVRGTSYAPSVFEEMPESGGNTNKAFALAMARLLSAGRIKSEDYGSPSRRRSRLVLT